MEKRRIHTLAAVLVFCLVSAGMWMTAWAEVLVPAMDIAETSAAADRGTVGIPGAIVEEAADIQGLAGEGRTETGSVVKTAGNRKKPAARAAVREKDQEETAAGAGASSGVIAAKGVKEAEEAAETRRKAMEQVGPGVTGKTAAEPAESQTPARGESLGIFKTTGYCTCQQCVEDSSGLTYSGTVPRARHTISADISLYPVGTRLMIDDVVYTVEDTGSGITGNWIDIYYEQHEEAAAHGVQMKEVFTVRDVP